MTPSDVKATLSFSDNSPSVEMPIYKGTMGPDVIDIRKLYGQTGKFTYDPGFMSTAACNSAITYIDGDKGELLYRGYPIDNLAQNADFLETCYLLLKGELPNAAQKKEFVDTVTKHTMVHEQMHYLLPAAEGRAAERRAKEGIRRHRHEAHDGARTDALLLPWLPSRRAPDGGAGGGRRRAVGVLSRLARHQRSASP